MYKIEQQFNVIFYLIYPVIFYAWTGKETGRCKKRTGKIKRSRIL